MAIIIEGGGTEERGRGESRICEEGEKEEEEEVEEAAEQEEQLEVTRRHHLVDWWTYTLVN